MAEFIEKLKKTIEGSLDTARNNAQNLKEIAEEYSKIAKLKFELHQLQSSKKRKMELLGETVYPFLIENKIDDLKKHETLQVLLDEIKNINNEIELTQKSIKDLYNRSKTESKIHERQQLKNQINDVEKEIESRIEEIKSVKESLDKKQVKQ